MMSLTRPTATFEQCPTFPGNLSFGARLTNTVRPSTIYTRIPHLIRASVLSSDPAIVPGIFTLPGQSDVNKEAPPRWTRICR